MAVSTAFCFLFLALVSFARAIPFVNCVYGSYGDLKGVPVELNTIRLNPSVISWDITITNVCDVSGVMMKVCDSGVRLPPTVKVLSKNEAIIKRHGSRILDDAMVFTTVYCEPENAQMNRVEAVPIDMDLKHVNNNNNVWV